MQGRVADDRGGPPLLAISPQKPEHSGKAAQEDQWVLTCWRCGNKVAGIRNRYKLPDVAAAHLTSQVISMVQPINT
jgi:hypothetical protein